MVPVLQKADLPIDTTTPYPQPIYPQQIQDINSPKYLHEQSLKELVPKELQKRSTPGHDIALINMGRDKTTDTYERKDKISAVNDDKQKIRLNGGGRSGSESRLPHHSDDDYVHHSASSSNDDQSQDGDSDNGPVEFSSFLRNGQDNKHKNRNRTQTPSYRRQPKLKILYASSDSDECDHFESSISRSPTLHSQAATDNTVAGSNNSSAKQSLHQKRRRPGRPRKDESRSSTKAVENSDSDESIVPNRRRRERQTTSDSTASKTKNGTFDPNRTDKAGRTRLFSCTGTGNLDRVKELVAMGASVNWRDNAGWTPLHEAALKGQAAVAKYLLACGADANARGFGNDTPLHDACSNGFKECIQILIDHGANINIKNSDGQRPMDVCENDDCIAILSKKQKELERMSARDKAGRTSLHRACATGQLEDSLILIKKGADLNAKDNASWTPLHEAALNGYLDIVKVLCEHGAQLNPTGYDGSTPLHEASENGHTSVVRYLLNMSANKTIRNKKGQTAAEVCDDKSIVDLFSADIKPQLESPKDDSIKRTVASTSVADSKGSSPANSKVALSGSSISKQPLSREEKKIQALMETFQKMEKRQAKKARRRQQRQHDDDDEEDEDDEDEPVTPATKEPDYRTKRLMRGRPRSTSLSQSREASEEATQSKKPVMKLDPKRKDTAGRTQLHKWAVRGDETTVRELLEAGANANEKDHAGWTPLHEAALRGRLEVLKLLLQHGADPNALGADKDTPLHDAVENGHGDVVRVLLEHGANASARNATDLDCLQIAKDNEDDDMIAILKAAAQKQHSAASSRQPKIEPSSEPNQALLKGSKSTTVADLAVSVKKVSNHSDDVLDPDQCSYGKTVKKRRLVTAAEYRSRSKSQEHKKSEEPPNELPHGHKIKVERERKLPQALVGGFDIFNVSPSPHRKPAYNHAKSSSVTRENDNGNDVTDMKMVKREQEDTEMIPSSKKKFWPSLSHAIQYLPLYTVQLQEITPSKDGAFYVVDLQVQLLLGIHKLFERYPHLEKRLVTEREKERLWSPLAFMVSERCAQAVKAGKDKEDLNIKEEKGYSSALDIARTKEQEKQRFLQTKLYFVRLDQIISIIKSDYSHLSNNLITITLDIGYSPTTETPHEKLAYPSIIPSEEDEAVKQASPNHESPTSTSPLPIKRPAFGLPAKFAMKMQKCGLGHKRDVSK